MTNAELKRALTEELTVPLWPHAGMALGYSRNTTYGSASRGEIPTVPGSQRLKRVTTAWIRKAVGMEAP